MIYDSQGLHVGAPATMRTRSGRHIDPFEMTTDDVCVLDIVGSLSRQCRFGGHTNGHLSVARHSLWVADWLEQHNAEWETICAGLLHDAAEAYIGDLIRPLKKRPEFAFFNELDDRVTSVILEWAGLPWGSLPQIVHEADVAVGLSEVNNLRFWYDSPPERDARDFEAAIIRWLPDHR